jgi:hypothetical protein
MKQDIRQLNLDLEVGYFIPTAQDFTEMRNLISKAGQTNNPTKQNHERRTESRLGETSSEVGF